MALYFRVRDHREVSAAEALDSRGVLKSGYGQRVPATLRDSRFGTGSGNRPGWRTADSDCWPAERDAAYRDFEQHLNDSWKSKAQRDAEKLCPECNGDGDINGVDCERCDGTGELDDDDNGGTQGERVRPVTADAMSAAHVERMKPIYDSYAQEISQQWRRGK